MSRTAYAERGTFVDAVIGYDEDVAEEPFRLHSEQPAPCLHAHLHPVGVGRMGAGELMIFDCDDCGETVFRGARGAYRRDEETHELSGEPAQLQLF